MRVQAAHFHAAIWRGIGDALEGSHRILEVGAGSGDDAEALARLGHEVVGIDVEPHEAWAARGGVPGLELVAGSAERLPFADASFDAVFERDALHHVGEPGRALREIRRVLRPGGVAVVVEANRHNPLFYVHMTRLHGHDHFGLAYLRGLMDATFDDVRLELVETRAYPFVPDGALPAVRLWERVVPRVPLVRRLAAYAVVTAHVLDPDRPVSQEAVFRGGLLPALQRRGVAVNPLRR